MNSDQVINSDGRSRVGPPFNSIQRKNLIKRLENCWQQIAGEPVEVEDITGNFYGYCSELGTLRLLKRYRHNQGAISGYSKNLGKFYFRLETSLSFQ